MGLVRPRGPSGPLSFMPGHESRVEVTAMARVRSRHTFTTLNPRFQTNSQSGSQTISLRASETMTDEETPRFKKLKRSGKPLPVNPMTQTATKLQVASEGGLEGYYPLDGGKPFFYRDCIPITGSVISQWSTTSPNNFYYVTSSWPQSPSYPPWPDEDVLLQKALAKARTAAWDVATFIAEFDKTVDMFSKLGRNIVRRGNAILNARKISSYSEFANAWLEYRYGWRILYYDIQDAQAAIDRLRGLATIAQRHTSYGETENTHVVMASSSSPPQWAYLPSYGSMQHVRRTSTFTYRSVRSVRAGVGLSINPDKPVFVDPINTLVEITPYAMVANWFINLKDAIAAWSPFAAGELQWAFVTREERREAEELWKFTSNAKPPHPNTLILSQDEIRNVAVRFTRERVPKQPTLNLRLRLNFDWGNLIDVISMVLAQRAFVRRLRGR